MSIAAAAAEAAVESHTSGLGSAKKDGQSGASVGINVAADCIQKVSGNKR